MKYKLTCEVTEDQMIKLMPMTKKIIPLYKLKAGAADIDWVHQNKDIIIDAACEFVWDMYCEAFTDDIILSRNKFYELIRSELNLESKMARFTDNVIKYSFVSKSTL